VSDYQKAKEGKLAAVEAEQRHLYAKISISDIAAEAENDQRENVKKFAQAHGVTLKWFMTPFTRICSSERIWQIDD
jgi:hypothetical protein